jgi:glyoxylase-like metal-dependent hydrolase (beta-lactamase superfamily II)
MMRTVFAVAVPVVMLSGWSAGVAQQPARPDPLVREGVTEKISEHVYVIPDGSVPLVPNVGIIVGSRGTFVVDTGLGARNGQAVLREVEKVSRNAELYLATTHVHPEHDLGAMAFPPSTRMIRSRDQEQEIAESGLETAQRFSGLSAVNAELLKGAEFRKATISFEREHAVDLGGARVRLIALGHNHTRGDTALYVEPDGVLFSGDVVMMALPTFGSPASSVQHWLESLDLFDTLQPKRIVPSHGAMGDAAMIANYRTFLTTVRTRATALKKDGKTLDETVQTIQNELQTRYDRQRMTSAIRAAYNEAGNEAPR